ncbi:hypothetical protein [Metabacillus fastidiosus]|uniref:hypothetical protein n=1 Tax=Metabacillus fastidiosus TaxID=1458 RepID=UPI003D2690D8
MNVKQVDEKEKIKLFKLSNEAFKQYWSTTKGNYDISKELAIKKLTRNILLAKEVKLRDKLDRLFAKRMFQYGNLTIITQWNRIIEVKNHTGGRKYGNWHFDKEKYIRLSEQLGIMDHKFAHERAL